MHSAECEREKQTLSNFIQERVESQLFYFLRKSSECLTEVKSFKGKKGGQPHHYGKHKSWILSHILFL